LGIQELERWVSGIRDRNAKNPLAEVEPEDGDARFEKGEEFGVDFLRSLQYWTHMRAYPNDSYDPTAYNRAAEARARMAPASRRLLPPGPQASAWEFVGPKNLNVPYRTYYGTRPTSGRVNNIAIDPTNGQRIFLATAGGGAWRTVDGGANWVPIGNDWQMQNTQSVAIDPKNPNTVYVGTGDFNGFELYPFGLLRSTDGGDTWSSVGSGVFGDRIVTAVLIDPSDSQTLFVAASTRFGDGFVWKSTNAGTTWSRAINVQSGWYNLKAGPADVNGKRAFYAIANGNSPKIYVSRDQGQTWTPATVPFGGDGTEGVDIAPSPIAVGTVYVLSGRERAIFKSTDFGATWTNITNNHPGGYNWSQSWYDWHLAVSHANGKDVLYTGLIDLAMSLDGGDTWINAGRSYFGDARTHNDQHGGAIDPSNPNRLIFGNDGGVYELVLNPADGTTRITGLSKTLGVTQFYDADWHPTDPDMMLGGTQDNATPVSLGDLENWENVGGGDGFQVWINPINPKIQYTTIYGNTVIKTVDGWQTQFDISPALNDPTPFVTPVEGDPNELDVVYTGNAWLHRYNGSSWTLKLGGQMLGANSNDFITAIKIPVGDSNVLYVATSQGRLWRSGDRGETWKDIRGNLPNRAITSIDIDPTNKNDILVGFSGFGAGHLFRTQDASAANVQWTNVSGTGTSSIPDIPLNAITRHWTNPSSVWFVATDVGVFMTEDAGSTWVNFGEPFGLPNARATAIKAVPGTAYLNVATYGRGMWRISLAVGAQLSQVSVAPTTVRGGQAAVGTVTLSEPAGEDTVVTLTSSSDKATVPPQVVVTAGQTSANFNIATSPVDAATAVTLTAASGIRTRTATLTINPPTVSKVSLLPASVYGGNPATGTVTLDAPAPINGTRVNLASDIPEATVPASVLVPAGGTTASFAVGTASVLAQKTARISASSANVVRSANLTVRPVTVASIAVDKSIVESGGSATGTIRLIVPAPPGGLSVSLSAGNASLVKVPSSITFPAGIAVRTFTIKAGATNAQVKTTISATRGASTQSVAFTVDRTRISALSAGAGDKVGGLTYEGKVTIKGIAPASGTVVALSSNRTDILTVPASVTVPAGKTETTFKYTTKGASVRTGVTITASLAGETRTATVFVLPPSLTQVTLEPTPITGGLTATAKATISGPAPKGGLLLTLGTSNSSVATTLASIRVPEGQRSILFYVYTKKVKGSTTVQVRATYAGVTKSASLTVRP
jgi:hypothetical protein